MAGQPAGYSGYAGLELNPELFERPWSIREMVEEVLFNGGLDPNGNGLDVRGEVATWFDDLRWGTPLARKLMAVVLALAFLSFCVFVLLMTFGGQAVL